MITIGYNQVQEKHIADSSGNPTEAKKVYVGNKLAHVHVNDNTEFALRQTLNGYIYEDNDLYAKVSKIKGNTKVWNQLVQNPTFVDSSKWLSLSSNVNIANNTATITKTTDDRGGVIYQNVNSPTTTHKYYIAATIKADSVAMHFGFHTFQGLIGGNIDMTYALTSWGTVKAIVSPVNSTDFIAVRVGVAADPIGSVGYAKDVNVIDLTFIYGAGNEPTTVAEFEADFQKWFGRPIGAEPYDAGSLIPFVGTGIKSTWTKDGVQKEATVPIPVTTLTGKAEGSTTSEVIFPDGMKSAGSVKDEIYVENGKTYAVKRVGSVDMGSQEMNWNKRYSGEHTLFASVALSGTVKNNNVETKANAVCPIYEIETSKAVYSHVKDKVFALMNSDEHLSVYDSQYINQTASQFQAAMSGVMLYYELATPIVYEVDNYTLPLYYLANGTGTEELQSTTTTAPADMDIEYRLLEEEWYGIRWRMTDDTWVSPVRIGNPRLHQELPIQSMMKRCALVNGVPKFISESNVDEYEDGTAVDYANTDIYVQIPEYYFEATKDDDGWCELKIHTKAKIGTKSRLYYEGAWLATLDNNVLGSKSYINFSAIGSPTDGTYNAALFKNATNFVANTPHGGNGSTAYDDTEGCNIGRPKTSTTITNFRTYAQNNSNRHGIINYDCWCSITRLFMVEFCSFYSQAAIDDTLTVHKFRKGGLSAGVTSGLTNWSNFNGYNPLIPCGFTKSLGNRTGVIKMHYAAEGAQTSAVNMSVPSYRGIEEPFGDIYNFVDGIAIYGDGAGTQKASIYVATAATIDNNAYVTPSGTNAAPTGYELLTDDAPYKEASDSETSGYIKVWHWDEHGMFAPLKTGGNSSTVGLTDYMYMYNGTGWRMLMAGGGAISGGDAGLGCFFGVYGFGISVATVGSRLLYTPAS